MRLIFKCILRFWIFALQNGEQHTGPVKSIFSSLLKLIIFFSRATREYAQRLITSSIETLYFNYQSLEALLSFRRAPPAFSVIEHSRNTRHPPKGCRN